MKPITIDGISFYPEAIANMSEAEFIEHEKHHYDGDPKATEKLQHAYGRILNKVAPVQEVAKADKKANPGK